MRLCRWRGAGTGEDFWLASPLTGHAVVDIILRDKGVWLRGGNQALVPIKSIANAAYRDLLRLPRGEMPGLEARHYYIDPQADLLAEGRKLRFQPNYISIPLMSS